MRFLRLQQRKLAAKNPNSFDAGTPLIYVFRRNDKAQIDILIIFGFSGII
jgi:hypothetical protein